VHLVPRHRGTMPASVSGVQHSNQVLEPTYALKCRPRARLIEITQSRTPAQCAENTIADRGRAFNPCDTVAGNDDISKPMPRDPVDDTMPYLAINEQIDNQPYQERALFEPPSVHYLSSCMIELRLGRSTQRTVKFTSPWELEWTQIFTGILGSRIASS